MRFLEEIRERSQREDHAALMVQAALSAPPLIPTIRTIRPCKGYGPLGARLSIFRRRSIDIAIHRRVDHTGESCCPDLVHQP